MRGAFINAAAARATGMLYVMARLKQRASPGWVIPSLTAEQRRYLSAARLRLLERRTAAPT